MCRAFLKLSCGKFYEIVYIIGLDFGFMCCFIAVYFAAFGAFVKYDIAFFRVCYNFYRVHNAVAFAGSVAGVYIYVERAKALGAVIARGVSKRLHFEAAVSADKAVIVFCEKFLFHIFPLFKKPPKGGFLLVKFISGGYRAGDREFLCRTYRKSAWRLREGRSLLSSNLHF